MDTKRSDWGLCIWVGKGRRTYRATSLQAELTNGPVRRTRLECGGPFPRRSPLGSTEPEKRFRQHDAQQADNDDPLTLQNCELDDHHDAFHGYASLSVLSVQFGLRPVDHAV